MFDATAPPKDEEIAYVGVWLDDHGDDEVYEEDRWAPFVRCVISAVGHTEEFRRHPRPLFGGTSFASSLWGPKFGRLHVEGLFVETPRSLAPRLLGALQTTLSIRGTLLVEQVEYPRFLGHALATSAWLAGDVCVGSPMFLSDDMGIRVAYTREDEDVSPYPRPDAEAMLLEAVARGVVDPKNTKPQQGFVRAPVETIVLRTEYDEWRNRQAVPAEVFVFDMQGMREDFDEHLIETVARHLAQKKYRSEVVLWSWIDRAAHIPRAYYVAFTYRGNLSPHTLLKGIQPTYVDAGADVLSDSPTPLLRWRPDQGLTRYWRNSPPADTTLPVGKTTVSFHHRIAGVVRRAVGNALDFRVERLSLRHVRDHDTFECHFPSRFHVIIGDNGRGKTTLLDALAALLRPLVEPKDRGELLRDDDVTERLAFHDTFSAERQYPATISSVLRVTGRDTVREVLTRDAQGSSRKGSLSQFMVDLVDRVRKLVPVDLPLCAYYRVARAHQPTAHPTLEITSPESRLSGYARALDERLDPLPFQRWFKTMELASLQDRRPNVLLETVREAVRRCIEGCETVQHVIARDEVMLRFQGGELRPFRQLSDGYRLTMAMVADIAWRCVTLNPHLGPAATEETSGIVLIDEIDLHLHPRWQRHIVDDLRSTFPRLQFIATTHSPFIVQSMKADEVLNLDRDEEMDYRASSIEDIAEEAMGLEGVQRSRRFQEMEETAAEYYRLLDEKPASGEEALRLKAKLDALILPFADNPAYVAFLRSHRTAKGLS